MLFVGRYSETLNARDVVLLHQHRHPGFNIAPATNADGKRQLFASLEYMSPIVAPPRDIKTSPHARIIEGHSPPKRARRCDGAIGEMVKSRLPCKLEYVAESLDRESIDPTDPVSAPSDPRAGCIERVVNTVADQLDLFEFRIVRAK